MRARNRRRRPATGGRRRPPDVRKCLVAFVLLPLATGACASTRAPGRDADWTDAVSVRVSAFTLGAHAEVGPAQAGLLGIQGACRDGIIGELGPGGTTSRSAYGVSAAVGVPLHFIEVGRVHRAGETVWRKPCGWRQRDPTFGSIGFDVGFLVGFGFHLDFVEIADALLGYTGIDFLHDDPPSEEPEAEGS